MFGLRMLNRAPALTRQALVHSKRQFSKTSGLNSGAPWTYRTTPARPEPVVERLATGVMALAWWWMLHGVFTEYEHIIGHYPYMDVTKLTDEELGIPPDDYEE